jgi:acyl-CoA synthetase (AMP-forming)/AMP-acid ligase II
MASGGRWASGYRLRLFASLQVLLQAWTAEGVFIAGTPAPADEIATYWSRSRAEYASATPSFWRRLLISTDQALLARIPLRQITLGGEAADQPLLDALRAAFVGARITHIYATTELGRCFAVSDGRAGFPASFLDGPSEDRPPLLVDHDELLVRRTAKGCWISTGDLVRIDGDRVHFTGRRDDLLNVGGQKVAPIDVERVLREAPGVVDVRVFGRRSALMGHLVACEIVVADGHEPDVVKRAVASHARDRLSAAEQPRFVEVVNEIGVSSADKIIRREGER